MLLIKEIEWEGKRIVINRSFAKVWIPFGNPIVSIDIMASMRLGDLMKSKAGCFALNGKIAKITIFRWRSVPLIYRFIISIFQN